MHNQHIITSTTRAHLTHEPGDEELEAWATRFRCHQLKMVTARLHVSNTRHTEELRRRETVHVPPRFLQTSHARPTHLPCAANSSIPCAYPSGTSCRRTRTPCLAKRCPRTPTCHRSPVVQARREHRALRTCRLFQRAPSFQWPGWHQRRGGSTRQSSAQAHIPRQRFCRKTAPAIPVSTQ